MAVAKAPYDPIKAIEGMFNGSVTRIAQALKNPTDYSGSTKTVLAECAKKYHDALDDCEIQLLDAKWYLEHQLKTNRLRREAQAREKGTAAKRKHEEIKEANEDNVKEQASAKKVKLDQDTDPEAPSEEAKEKETVEDTKAVPATSDEKKTPKKPDIEQKKKLEDDEKAKQQGNQTTQSSTNTQPTQAPPPSEDAKPPPQQPPDDFAKPTPQATPNDGDDDLFDFSFDEPGNDLIGNSNKDDDDLGFDFTADDFGTATDDIGAKTQDAASLDTFLPGVESYANQADDNNIPNSNNNNSNTTNALNNIPNAPAAQVSNALPSFTNDDFGLPSMNDGPNIFDEFLNEDGLGFMNAGGSGGNFDDNIDLSDPALLDMNFDNFE